VGVEGEEGAGDDEIHIDMCGQHIQNEVVNVGFGRVEAGGRRSGVDVSEDGGELLVEFIDGRGVALHNVSGHLERGEEANDFVEVSPELRLLRNDDIAVHLQLEEAARGIQP
jgi:hypothetical protein